MHLAEYPAIQAVVDEVDLTRSRARESRFSRLLLVLYAVLLMTLSSLILGYLVADQDARSASLGKAVEMTAQPEDPSRMTDVLLSDIEVELHQENSSATYLGVARPVRSLYLHFWMLVPSESRTTSEDARWNVTLPEDTIRYRVLRSTSWDSEPMDSDPVESTIAPLVPVEADNRLLVTPYDFGVKRVLFEGEAKDFRILEVGVQAQVGDQITVGHDPDYGLAAETVAFRWKPPSSRDWLDMPNFYRVDSAGRELWPNDGPPKVSLGVCRACFIFTGDGKQTRSGDHWQTGSASAYVEHVSLDPEPTVDMDDVRLVRDSGHRAASRRPRVGSPRRQTRALMRRRLR